MKTSHTPFSRREFLATSALALGALATRAQAAAPRLKLGFDNFSLRSLGWKAGQFLDYAATQKLDVMMFSDLKVYESHDEAYLRELKKKADGLGLEILVGTYSICPTSAVVTKDYGTPAEHLALAIRIAKTLGSPAVRCVLGNGGDRNVEGGIQRQIDNTVAVLKQVRQQALDAGVKIAVENHAGDMQAWELIGLIEAAGKDFVGATMDSGNAAWTLEDPLMNLELLGPYAVATGIRDTAVWETPEGVQAQWTAMGEGNTDWKKYVERFAALCPDTPFVLEIISEYGKGLPYLTEKFWKPFPNVRPHEFARFTGFARGGKKRDGYKVPAGTDKDAYAKEFAKAELERSLTYCRETLGIGRKT